MQRLNPDTSVHLLSDTALEIRLGEQIDPAVSDRVLQLAHYFKTHPLPGLSDIIPSYTRIVLRFDPYQLASLDLVNLIDTLPRSLPHPITQHAASSPTLHIPVLYEGSVNTDLSLLSERLQLSISEIIHQHTAQSYRVYMLGFLPGFPYLGVLPKPLQVARKSKPERVVAGTVAIAAAQTGVYPADSPGGWWRLGRTPLPLFIPTDERINLFEPGDQVHFYSIDQATFTEIQSKCTHYSLGALREKGGWL